MTGNFINKIVVLVMLVTALTVAGCAPPTDVNQVAPDSNLQATDLRLKGNRQGFQALASNQQSALTFPTKTNLAKPILHLDEVQGDGLGYSYMAKALIENNPEVQKALRSAKPSLVDEGLSSKDVEWITSELGNIKGFNLTSHGGTAVKYERYVIAVVGGFIDDKFFNAYFIRIPGCGWTYLEKKEVPTPLGTYRQ